MEPTLTIVVIDAGVAEAQQSLQVGDQEVVLVSPRTLPITVAPANSGRQFWAIGATACQWVVMKGSPVERGGWLGHSAYAITRSLTLPVQTLYR